MTRKRPRQTSLKKLAAKRPTGLDGSYTGTCIGCLRPTDTALGIRGVPEWHAAGLVRLGLPMEEAIATVQVVEFEPGPDGRHDAAYRVCQRCAARGGLPQPVLAVDGERLPTIVQP
jgi:hypothetical protein